MSLPVRSPPKKVTTSSVPPPATLVFTMSPSQRQSNNSTSITPKIGSAMSRKEGEDSSPVSPRLSTCPKHPSPASTTACIVQPELKPASTTPPSSPPQEQPAQTSHHCLKSSDTNMNAKSLDKRSPKRTREENDGSSSAFGTPPPKRVKSKASAASNGKAKQNKAAPPKKPARKKATPKSAAAAPTPSRSQPSRSRKAPERFEEIQEKEAPKAPANKKGQSKVFDPVFITTNSSSRLVKADIYHMLLEGAAWTCLSAEQQSMLISMLPQDTANKALLGRVSAGETECTRPPAFTLANDCFRTDVAKFQEDLANGHLAKTWQTAAEQAVIERAAGEYDRWKAEEAELWWGQKST